MEITSTEIRSALMTNQSAAERMNQLTARLSSGSRTPQPSDDPVRWGDVQRLKDSASRLQVFSENLSSAALGTRIASASMEASDRQLVEMRESLDRALGSPPGSAGRRSALLQYNEFHRLADDFSRPEDLNARQLLDDPERFEYAGDLEVAAGENNFRIRLSHQPIHLGADGLDVPEAGASRPSDTASGPVIADIANATNEEIMEMGELLTQARERLKERQAGLSADVLAVERQEEFGASLRSRFDSVAHDVDSADLEAEAALVQSVMLRSRLALSGITGLNETRSLALQLLR
jgi:flagellin-like hook-associated protein FlgL